MSKMAKAARRVRLVPADEVIAKARKTTGYREAYDALEEEFSLIAALIKARIEAGLTQEQVAKRMNTTQAVIARLEGGGRQPSTRTLRRFARATGHKLKISFEPAYSVGARRAVRGNDECGLTATGSPALCAGRSGRPPRRP